MSEPDSAKDKEQWDLFNGDWLFASDIQGEKKTFVMEIAEVIPPGREKDKKGKIINKPILKFTIGHKRLILSKCNTTIIRSIYGASNKWAGKTIELTVRYLPEAFGEKNVPAIRVVHPTGALPYGVRKHYGQEFPVQ